MVKQIVSCVLFFLVLPFFGYSVESPLDHKFEVLDTYNQKIKGDSLTIVSNLDSAKVSYLSHEYKKAIDYADKTYKGSQNFPNSDYAIESILILARSYKDIYLQHTTKSAFNHTLKYYLKAITILESVDSDLLPKIYKEYGDFYLELDLLDLTIKNYDKAFSIVSNGEDFEFTKELLEKLAFLNYSLGNHTSAIGHYTNLLNLHRELDEEDDEIKALKILSQLYRETGDYDNAISDAKTIRNYYKSKSDKAQEVTYQSLVGEISYEAENKDQADKAFKLYFNIVNNDEALRVQEIASLRYIKNLITQGDIYSWHTEHGYWSDYKTSIRHYNEAFKYTDIELFPALASEILNRTGSIYFTQEDYKTCITYFDLALICALKSNKYDYVSENHIMLARTYDALELWEEASDHYEQHSAYKDSIIQSAKEERIKIAQELNDNKKQSLEVEQTLDMIETQEMQELALAEKELRNIKLENEVALFRKEVDLKNLQLQNQKLAEDSTKRNLQLTKEQYENEINEKTIENLRYEAKTQDIILKKQESDRKLEKQQILFLEQENTLAQSRQAYYMLSIILISLILIFILVVYLQKRKANSKLRSQNEKIESQSEKLKQAYENLDLLSTIGRDITSSLIIEQIIETVYENLNMLMDASVLGIGVYQEAKNKLLFPAVRERNQRLDDFSIPLTNDNTLAALCFNKQKEIIIGNFHESYSEYIQPEIKPIRGDGNSISIIYMPLTIGNKKLGVLTVQSFDTEVFSDYHINIIRNIAIYTKIALENANVYRELEIQSQSLQKANKNIGKQNKLIEEQYKQLLSINEEKNNLMNILAHDLRNPLATAMSMTELVRYEKSNLSAEQYQASEIIWRGLNRMDDMIRKILDIKAVESHQVNLDFDIYDANDLIQPLERLFSVKAERKEINLHFTDSSSESYIKVDRHYLIQIMENLISNALKFSPPNKNVFVNIADEEDVVRISVRDEGPGIPKNELENLFIKYRKLSPKPTGGEQSIGLGLSIVKKYVEVMHGAVNCESTVGEGSTFILEFKKERVPVS